MSTLEVDKLTPQSGTSLTLGDNGDTFTLPSGTILTATSATVNLPATQTVTTELKTNKISPASGTAFTFGDSGDTFTIPSGVTITNNGTQTGFGGTNTPNFRVYRNSTQSISDASITKVQFDTEDYDSAGAYDNSTNYRFTVPSGQAGLYFLTSRVYFNYTGSNRIDEYRIYLYKNGSELVSNNIDLRNGGSPAGGQDITMHITGVFNLAVSDYIEVFAFIDYGGSADISGGSAKTDFTGFKLVT